MKMLVHCRSEGRRRETDAGHWQIDPAELARVYQTRTPQTAVSRTKPEQLNRDEPEQKADVDQDTAARLVRAEAELAAERKETALLERHLDDVRRVCPRQVPSLNEAG